MSSLVINAIYPLFDLLAGIMFDTHLVLVDEEALFDGRYAEKALHPLRTIDGMGHRREYLDHRSRVYQGGIVAVGEVRFAADHRQIGVKERCLANLHL